jgi:UTP-glucose-1-phosphate uridylyltransferase
VCLPRGEKRYDIGNFPSYFETFVEFALADPVHGPDFRKVLERLVTRSAAAAE